MQVTRLSVISVLALGSAVAAAAEVPADLILYNSKIWTADVAKPHAQAVAIRGSRIVKVGSNKEVLRLRGPSSRVLNLQDRLVVPGFIDGHTHFENATEWHFQARLMDVASEAEMIERVRAATGRLPKGHWITGGDWGESEARKAKKQGENDFVSFTPTLAALDAVSPDHPVLLRRHNGDYFANSQALQTLRITKHQPNPGGGEYVRGPDGELTGMLLGRAGERAFQALPPKSKAKTLVAARALMRELNSNGITSIHDMARLDENSQQHIFHTHVERSQSDVSIFRDLRSEGSLSVRVYAMLPLPSWRGLAHYGVAPRSGDDMIRFGALKSFIDGGLMFEPYTNNPTYAGDFTFRVLDADQMRRDFLGADKLGFDMATHQIGDKAISLYLDWMEEALRANGPRERRPRLIHMNYPGLREIKRAGALRAFADITPVHMVSALDEIEPKLGAERARTAFAGRTLIDNGVRINLVSDWPGDFYGFEHKPLNPLENIFYAVARREIGDPPTKAWHPSEAITIEEGLQAYTINPALAAGEAEIKGSISEGKLADLVVLSRDVLKAKPQDLLSTKVLYTVFDGRIVHDPSPR